MATATRPLPSTLRRPGRVALRVQSGPDAGREYVLDQRAAQRLVGGRASHNDIVLSDEHASSAHFELSLHPQHGVILRDLGSTNGITIGEVRVIEARLSPGATFRVGSSVLELLSTDAIAVSLSQEPHFGAVYGESPVMRELFADLEKIAGLSPRLSVLLIGATGTGKELVARALHDRSPRSSRPIIAVNCAAIPANLAESYLFGQRRGAFTGALDQAGCFEAADGGTLFLDELGELPLDLQPKLLRALQEGEITRIGEHTPRRVDVRLIAATHRDLRWMVNRGAFRADLFYRLARVQVNLPTLRERPEDIVPLATRILRELADNGGPRRRLTPAAEDTLRAHTWPGNVRELRNTIETAYFLAEGPTIAARELRLEPWGPPEAMVELPAAVFAMTSKEARVEFERLYYKRLLASPGTFGDKARRAGLSVEGLRQVRRRLKLEPEDPET